MTKEFQIPVKYSSKVHQQFDDPQDEYQMTGFTMGENNAPAILFLHGGGATDAQSAIVLLREIAEAGFYIIAPNFSGSGDPDKQAITKYSSLQKRIEEAEVVINKLVKKPNELIVIASTMGAYIATQIAAKYQFKRLIALCPPSYSNTALQLRFGPEFTKDLHRKDSYKENNIQELIKEYSGEVVLFRAKDDPRDKKYMQDYIDAVPKKNYIEIDSNQHSLLKHYEETKDVFFLREILKKCI